MNFLLRVMGYLGAALLKVLPLLFIYFAGKKEVMNDVNEDRAKDVALPDAAIADKLRDRAKRKNKD